MEGKKKISSLEPVMRMIRDWAVPKNGQLRLLFREKALVSGFQCIGNYLKLTLADNELQL